MFYILNFSFYENLCEKFAGCCSDPNCSQIVLHSGLKCPFCPIDPVHLVMNYHRHGKRSFLESVTAFFEALGKGFSILSTMMSWLQLLSGRLELLTLNENNATSAWDFMWNVSIKYTTFSFDLWTVFDKEIHNYTYSLSSLTYFCSSGINKCITYKCVHV